MSKREDCILDNAPVDEKAINEGNSEENIPKTRRMNSMLSLLINSSDSKKERDDKSKKMKRILINEDSTENKGSTCTRNMTPQTKKIQEPQLPLWEQNLAINFLMTCNMSNSNEDVERETVNQDIEHITEEMTRCICNSNHESDVMILCDSCKKWMHVDCVRLQNSQDVDPFVCIYCQYEMSKAIKSFVRRKLMNIFSKIKEKRIHETSSLWNDLLQTILDIQSILRIVPQFLPVASSENV